MSGHTTARIEFLAATRDEHNRIVHHPGEVIIGELLSRKNDFLLVRTSAGNYMYVDSSRSDLYSVDMQLARG